MAAILSDRQAYLGILTLTFVMGFSPCRKWIISIRKEEKCLWICAIKELGCVCLLLCGNWCGCFWPKHFWHSDNLQHWKCCFWKTCIVDLWRMPYSDLEWHHLCVLQCGRLEKLGSWKKTRLPTCCPPAVKCELFFLLPAAVDLEGMAYGGSKVHLVVDILAIRTYCLVKKAKSQLSKQEFQTQVHRALTLPRVDRSKWSPRGRSSAYMATDGDFFQTYLSFPYSFQIPWGSEETRGKSWTLF